MTKRATLRAINQGTYRDVTGRMRSMVRQLERKEFGEVTDAILTLRVESGDSVTVKAFHFGPGGVERAHWMLSTVMRRVEPA